MEVFWEAFWEPWALGNHAKVYNFIIFRVWTLSVRSLFRDLLLEGVWHAFFKILVPIGAPIGTPLDHFWQLFQGLILEAVSGWQKEANDTRNGLAGGSGGAC